MGDETIVSGWTAAPCSVQLIDIARKVVTEPGDTNSEQEARPLALMYPPDARGAGDPERDIHAASACPIERLGWRLRSDGTRYWAHVLMAPVANESGTVRTIAIVVQDLGHVRPIARPSSPLAFTGATPRNQANALRAVIEAYGDEMPAAARAQLALVAMDLDQVGRAMDASSQQVVGPCGVPRKFDRRRR